MAEETVVMDGVKYISSSRAAKLVGYTKDYVGQLCRAGKIDAQLIGRSWYVSEDSVRSHKLSVHYTLKSPKKPRKNKEKKKEGVTETQTAKPVAKPPHYAEVPDEKEDEGTFDLMPVVKKQVQKKDVLLHSDIQYEHDEPVKSSILSKKDGSVDTAQDLDFRTIKIRKPVARSRNTQERLTPRSRSTSRSGASIPMDGIVVNESSLARDVRRLRPRVKSKQDVFEEEMIDERGATLLPDEYQRPARNKAVPVLGGIVIIVLAIIVYSLV